VSAGLGQTLLVLDRDDPKISSLPEIKVLVKDKEDKKRKVADTADASKKSKKK
jgi:hypothetical protein